MTKATKKTTNYFTELHQAGKDNQKEIVEKKGKFNYISWAYAVRELKKIHPSATWTVHEYGEGFPFIKTECGFFVKVTVTINGIDATQIHPVLDHKIKTINSPDAFQINTSIQRCLAKAIALHGFGLHIFVGEDLPSSPPIDALQQKELLDLAKDRNVEKDLLDQIMGQISSEKINKSNFLEAMEYYTNTL